MWLACYTIQKGARKWQRYHVNTRGGVQFGSPIDLTSYINTSYTCPCDGYADLNQSAVDMALNYINIVSNGIRISFGQTTLAVVPVKKGMQLRLINGGGTIFAARFYPLVDI